MAMPHGADWRWIALAALWLAGPGALMLDPGYSGGRLFDLAFGAVVATGFTRPACDRLPSVPSFLAERLLTNTIGY
jgi:hypothetical protein